MGLIAGLLSGEASGMVGRARSAAAAYAVAALLALFGIAFLVVGGYVAAAQRFGQVEAALGIGVAFLVVAGVVVLVHDLVARARARRAALRRSSDIKRLAMASGFAAIPPLMKGRAGRFALLGTAIAAVLYAIYQENSRPPRRDRDADSDEARED